MPAAARSPVSEQRSFWKDKLRGPWGVCLLLTVAVIALYWPAARHDFVNYDDGDYITGNTHVQKGITWDGLRWAFQTGHASNWHPLTWVSHMLDCQLFGQRAGLHHLTNVAFHFANTVLLFLVLRQMTGRHWRSAFVAALFAVHPLHVESVAWVSERKDVLSTFFLFLTLGAYTLYVQAKRTDGGVNYPEASSPKPGRGSSARRLPPSGDSARRTGPAFWYITALVMFSLGLMSKPMLVSVPFLLLLLDYWPFQRVERALAITYSARFWLSLVIEKLPFLALAIASSIVTFLVQQHGGAVSVALSLGQRLGNAAVSYARYLYKTFWPADLSVLYPHPGSWPAWQVGAATVLLVVIFAFVLHQRRARPYLVTGWLWFFGMLIPVIGIVQVGIQSMADRYTYVPLAGLSIAMTWGVAELFARKEGPARGLATCAAVALLACGLFTAQQVTFWKDSESLFRRAVEVTKNNYLAYNNLGYYLSNRGKPLEAMECYRKSLAINGSYEDALNNMGFVLAGMKRHGEAVPYYEAALRVKPRHVEVHNNLGNALSELGRIPEAIEHYRIALDEKPDHADAHNNLGIALAMQGKLDEAIPHFRDAIRYKRNYASAHSNLGNALAAQKKWDEAIGQYEECLRLNPADPQAHNNLANVLISQGKLPEAIAHYQTALHLNANNPEAHFNLGMALLQQSKRSEAREHFAEALRLRPDYTEAQRQLSVLTSGPTK